MKKITLPKKYEKLPIYPRTQTLRNAGPIFVRKSTARLTDAGWNNVFGVNSEDLKQSDYYKNSVWVYSCINAIAHSCAVVPFKVYMGSAKEPSDYEKDKVARLFRDVNPLMSRYQLFEATNIFLEGWGECFWLIEGKPAKEIWIFPPSCFNPVIKSGMLKGWEFTSESRHMYLSPEEVVHFKLYNPYSLIRGMSRTTAARLSIQQDYQSSNYTYKFYKNDATPGIVLKYPDMLDDFEYRRIQESWETRHKGADKSHRMAILEGGMDIERISLSNKDMQWIEAKKLSREEICAIFKVPPAEAGIMENSRSYANAYVQDRGFWEKTIIPRLRYIEDTLNTNFFPVQFPGYSGYFDLSEVSGLEESLNEKLDAAKKLFDLGYPVNMINERLDLGMPDYEHPVASVSDEKKNIKAKEIESKTSYRTVASLDMQKVEDIIEDYADDLRNSMESFRRSLVGYVADKSEKNRSEKVFDDDEMDKFFAVFKSSWIDVANKWIRNGYKYGQDVVKFIFDKLDLSQETHEKFLNMLLKSNMKDMSDRIEKMKNALSNELAEMSIISGQTAVDTVNGMIDGNIYRAKSFAGFMVRVSHTPYVEECKARSLWAIWEDTGDIRECPDCLDMARRNPWDLQLLPRLPGQNVQCNGNCRCHLRIVERKD